MSSVLSETDHAAFIRSVSRTQPHVKTRVNLNSGVVACREPDRMYREIDRILKIVGDRTNCVLGSGAAPLEILPENIRLMCIHLANRERHYLALDHDIPMLSAVACQPFAAIPSTSGSTSRVNT